MKFFFLIALLSFSAVSHANSSHFLVGGNYTYVHFEPKGESSFHGNLGGIQTSYEYKAKNSIYESIKLTYRQGELKGSAGKRAIHDFDGQGNIGYTFKNTDFLLTPFTGFGWRYIQQKLKQTGMSSLIFFYNEVYIPVGIDTDFCINSSFLIGLRGTWMPQVFSSVKVKPIGNVRWDLERPLGNVMVELPLTFYFSRKKVFWKLQLNPFFQYWQDGKTSATTTRGIAMALPGNIYKSVGVEVNLGCSF